MAFIKTTESKSVYRDLEKLPVKELLQHINTEDKKVAFAVEKVLPAIQLLVEAVSKNMLSGGRLFYIGAGTSGRLGIVDASECAPTFGIPKGTVTGIIAGGDIAIKNPVEFAEDDLLQGWIDLQSYQIDKKDFVIGLSASGTTPYVVEAIKKCRENNIGTGCICCNAGSPLALACNYPVEVVVGAEFLTGSSRMKAGTAQKLILNMISTAVMIQMGRVEDNEMVHMQLTNTKLLDRGTKMIMTKTNNNYEDSKALLITYGSVKKALDAIKGH